MKLTKLSTVNVMEMTNGNIQAMHSFTDTKKGNKQAELLFAELVRENYPEINGGDIEDALEDGIFDRQDGYQLYLIHSDTSSMTINLKKTKVCP